MNVRNVQELQSDNKKLISKVDRVENELKDIKEQNSQMQNMMKELLTSIQLRKLEFFPKMVKTNIDEVTDKVKIFILNPDPLKSLSSVLEIMDKVNMRNFIYYYVELQVAAIWNMAKMEKIEGKKALTYKFCNWKKYVANAVEVYDIDVSKKPIVADDIADWHNELKATSFHLYDCTLIDAVSYKLIEDDTFNDKKTAKFSKMMSLLKDIRKAKEKDAITTRTDLNSK